MTVFRLGLPVGSLNSSSRSGDEEKGCACELLYGAGLDPGSTYRPNMPKNQIGDIRFRNFHLVEGLGVESFEGVGLMYGPNKRIDGIITGEDCVMDYELGPGGSPSIKVAGLGFGGVRLVIAAKKGKMAGFDGNDFYEYVLRLRDPGQPQEGKPVYCCAEQLNIAENDVVQSPAFQKRSGGRRPKILSATGQPITNGDRWEGFVIQHVPSNTEIRLERGANFTADYVIVPTQTGTVLRNMDAEIVRQIMESEAGFYVPEDTMNDQFLSSMAGYMEWMLKNAKYLGAAPKMSDHVMVKANVRRKHMKEVVKVIRSGRYCDESPSILPHAGNREFYAIEVDMPMGRWPSFTYDIWNLNRELEGVKGTVDDETRRKFAVRDIRRLPVAQALD